MSTSATQSVTHVSTEHIEITDQMSGQPKLRGRRITVAHVKMWHADWGWSVDHICKDFALSPAQVHDALAYYYDHAEEIERQLVEEREWMEEFIRQNPSPQSERIQRIYEERQKLKREGKEHPLFS